MAADKAVELAPDLGESHLAQALYYYHGLRDFVSAERELNLAAPTMAGTTQFLLPKQIVERRFGHWKDAVRDGEKAMSLNPRDAALAGVLIQTYRALRMYSEGEKLADDTIAKVPADAADDFWTYKCDFAFGRGMPDQAQAAVEATPGHARWKTSVLAMVAFYKRDYAEASRILSVGSEKTQEAVDVMMEADLQRLRGESKSRSTFEQAQQLLEKKVTETPNDPNLVGYLAFCYAAAGQKEEALAAIQRAAALAPISQDAVDSANWMGTLAEVYILTGDSEAALEQLAKVVRLPNGLTYGDLLLNPDWDPIRNDPRFQETLAQALKPPVYN